MRARWIRTVLVAGAFWSTAAEAHIEVASGQAIANSTNEVTFSVGHGCTGADTYRVSIDIPARSLTLDVPEEEIARRRAAQPPITPRAGVTGYLARYVKLVCGAEKGAVLQ